MFQGFLERNLHYYLHHTKAKFNTQTNSGPVTTATIPYIRGTSETIARILAYITTLQYTCCTQTDNHSTATAY